MTKLRDDLRTAFEREQTALGSVGDARDRLMRDALARRNVPASRTLQWAAGIAAVLIAAIVIATFALARANSHSQVVPSATPTPKAAVSPTPLHNVLGVPDATPIITYGDPAKPDQVDGVTWDGKLSGVLGSQPATAGGNPANNLFGTATDITDRSGKTVASGNFGAKFFGGTWADDEAHFCQMVPFDTLGANGVPATLQIVTPGQPPRSVAQVGSVYEQASIGVAACSVLADRAVVVQSFGNGGPEEDWAVQLSTGKILWHHTFDRSNSPAAIVASRDGMYVAENLSGPGLPITAAGSTIYGSDGRQLAHINTWVEAFSWDGSLAVVDTGWGSGGVQIVSWRDGTIVWSAPAGYGLQQAKPEPGGTAIALWLIPVAQFSQPTQLGDLYVVSASGKVVVHIANVP